MRERLACMLNRTVESEGKSETDSRTASGAKAPAFCDVFSARLKSCPFTKAADRGLRIPTLLAPNSRRNQHGAPVVSCADTKPAYRSPWARVNSCPDTKGKYRSEWRAALAVLFLLSLVLVTTGCRRKHFPTYPTDFREYAWVTNGGGNSVTVFDLVHMTTAATIPVGDDPTDVAVSPTRDEVYVVNRRGA